MITTLIKWTFWLIIILIIFAILPKEILDKLKQFFNWDVFFNTLKIGFNNLMRFLKEALGIDFNQFLLKLKTTFGIDLIALWSAIKILLSNLFEKLANFFK